MKLPCFFLMLPIFCLAELLQFQPGGTSLDFEEISGRRFKLPQNQKSMLGDQWKQGSWGLRSRLTDPLIVFRKTKTDKGLELAIDKPEKMIEIARTLKNPASLTPCNSWFQKVTMPDLNGGTYEISFEYKSIIHGRERFDNYVVFWFYDSQGKSMSYHTERLKAGSGIWTPYRNTVTIPEKVAVTGISLRSDGCGEIIFANPSFSPRTYSYPASVLSVPHGLMDNAFMLSQGDPALLFFTWKRNISKQEWIRTVPAPRLHLQLPPGIEFLESCSPMPSPLERQGNTLIFSLQKIKGHLNGSSSYSTWYTLPVMLTTAASPDTKLSPAFYWLSNNGKRISEKESLHFGVLPGIRIGRTPRRFISGYHPHAGYHNFKAAENREAWAKFIRRAGFNCVLHGDLDAQMMQSLRKQGLELYFTEPYWLANGYRIGTMQNKPDYARFKYVGKPSDINLNYATCPAAIYKKTEYYHKNILPYIQRSVKGTDGVNANWEPYMFRGMGCFCDSCRKDFSQEAGIALEELSRDWPGLVQTGGKYHDRWTKFRSRQHGRVIQTVQEAVMKYSSGKAGFMAEICWTDAVDRPGEKRSSPHDVLDYGKHVKWICPWGPYVWWKTMTPFIYEKGANLQTFAAARRVRQFLDRHFTPEERPRAMAMPHGIQSNFYVTTPEAMAMETLAFFVAGFDASTVYFFPSGYDNRYWNAMAKANEQIAWHEDLVMTGKRIAPAAVSPVSPYPAPKQMKTPESLLQTVTYSSQGKILAAVGNFWERGEVFFKLSVSGLSPDLKYTVLEQDKQRSFVNQNGQCFSGRELSGGIMLHAGALRWAFFTIAPEKQLPVRGRTCRPSELSDLLKQRLSGLQKAAEKERKLDQAEAHRLRKSDLKELKSGASICRPETAEDGSQYLNFTAENASLRLKLKGMSVTSWKSGGVEFTGGNLGTPAFWNPAVQINDPFFIIRQEADSRGFFIEGEVHLTRKNALELDHVRLVQSLEISTGLDRVVLRTRLINQHTPETGMTGIAGSFRYHMQPACLGKGEILLNPGSRPVRLSRLHRHHILGRSQSEAAGRMKKLFTAPEKIQLIDENRVIWCPDKGVQNLEMTVNPGKLFAGFGIWDTANMKYPTFEPFFNQTAVPPGDSADYEIIFQMIPKKKGTK